MRTSFRLLPFGLMALACSSAGSDDSGAPAAGGSAGALNSAAGSSAGSSSAGANSSAGADAGSAGRAHAGNSSGDSNGGGSNGGGGNSSNAGASAGGSASLGGSGGAPAWAAIAPATSWQWQLTGNIDTSLEVAVYDIDLFDASAATVSALQQKGAQVICYMSVGSYEDWRPDAADFPKAVLGKDYPGWPGEKFLDIRALDALGPILQKRMDLCKSKGFDGLEPDNMDVFEGGNKGTGFPLTEADGVAYAKWLTSQAHARGLSIGQKNTSELAAQLATLMDWALTEDCFDQDWCADMQPYITHGKAVLMSEYTDTGVNFGNACAWAKAHQFSAILKGRDLDAPVQFCP
jgi:hypothetical protein